MLMSEFHQNANCAKLLSDTVAGSMQWYCVHPSVPSINPGLQQCVAGLLLWAPKAEGRQQQSIAQMQVMVQSSTADSSKREQCHIESCDPSAVAELLVCQTTAPVDMVRLLCFTACLAVHSQQEY